MAYSYLHSELVRFSHCALVGEEDICVLVLVKDDAVATSFLGSLNLLSQLAHGDQSSLCHDFLDVKLGDGRLLDWLSPSGFNGLLKLLSHLFLGQLLSGRLSFAGSIRALRFNHLRFFNII